MKEYQQEKNKNFGRIKEILLGVFILLAVGISGYFLSLVLFVEAQVSLPIPTSPPLSCTGCHSFQASLFNAITNPYIIPYHHPNAISFPPIDMVTHVNAVRQDCCACHNYQISHTGGIVMLKDPDPTDFFPYNGDPVRTNNFCLSCHDDPGKPVGFNSINGVNGLVSPEEVIAPMWCLPCAHNRIGLRCLDCHKYHGSAYKDMLKLNQPNLCYMSGCHPEKEFEFHHKGDLLNESHHHVEGVLIPGVLGPTEANVIECCDCHNPHHNTIAYPISDPYSQLAPSLYPVTPKKLVTSPIETLLFNPPNPPILILESGPPFFVGQTNSAGVPLADLFCLECHAPRIFVPPNPYWAVLELPELGGAPDISYEITNKEYLPGETTSNFFYFHGHDDINSKCKDCHINFKKFPPPERIINGHFTHMKNASCTYCHDPHGTPGTYIGERLVIIGGSIVGGVLVNNFASIVLGIQRGHLLGEYFPSPPAEDRWLLTKDVNLLPYGGGYLAKGVYPSSTSITSVDGASSCFINRRKTGCHSISHRHTGFPDAPVIEACVCNRVACHQPFDYPPLARKGDKMEGVDTLAPEPPK